MFCHKILVFYGNLYLTLYRGKMTVIKSTLSFLFFFGNLKISFKNFCCYICDGMGFLGVRIKLNNIFKHLTIMHLNVSIVIIGIERNKSGNCHETFHLNSLNIHLLILLYSTNENFHKQCGNVN